MEQQFRKEKRKEIVRRNKYTIKTISWVLTFGIGTSASIIVAVNMQNVGCVILFATIASVMMVCGSHFGEKLDKKEKKTILNYVEAETQKKVSETFIHCIGEKGEEVNRALRNIVFSETRPTQEEINKINEITKAFNELQEHDEIIQGSYLFNKKIDTHINNLWERKYLNEEIDFEEKEKQRLDRIIQEHELKLKTPPTNDSIKIMLMKCYDILDEQRNIKLHHNALKDIAEHLQKIMGKSHYIKEEERIRISSVVNEIIDSAKEYEKPIKTKIEMKIEEKLGHL